MSRRTFIPGRVPLLGTTVRYWAVDELVMVKIKPGSRRSGTKPTTQVYTNTTVYIRGRVGFAWSVGWSQQWQCVMLRSTIVFRRYGCVSGAGCSSLGPLRNKSIYLSSTVPFRLIRPSRVTGPVVLAEFSHLSRVTTPMADDFWWIQKMVKKGFLKDIHGVGQMQHFFLLTYLRINKKIYLRFNC